MTWSPEIVRARFVEATDTEARLPGGGLPQSSGYWPSYLHTFEDMAGWGTQRLAEEREMRSRRSPPSAAAITRYFETMRWTAEFLDQEDRRRLVWSWAYCQMSGRSFAERLRKKGVVKMTAYRRLNIAFQAISDSLRKAGALLRYPDEKWVLPNHAPRSTNPLTLNSHDDAAPPHPTFQVFDGDRPGHTLTSPQAVEEFEKFLAKTNRQRRREQERRRKLGLEESAA
jgi:hypothetical protein